MIQLLKSFDAMNKFLLAALGCAVVMIAGCSVDRGLPQTQPHLPFTVAERYFVKNNVSVVPVVFKDKASFEKVFGMASFMGKNGLPTPIDFEKSFVIAVAEPETDHSTELMPVSLSKGDNGLVFTYEAQIGEKMTYRMRPSMAIIVDKTLQAPVTVERKEVRK